MTSVCKIFIIVMVLSGVTNLRAYAQEAEAPRQPNRALRSFFFSKIRRMSSY